MTCYRLLSASTQLPSRLMVTVVMMVMVVLPAQPFPQRRDSIPNGYKISDPCRPGRTAQGVGHLNPDGGGELNKFGEAFRDAGFMWTVALCNADSDGDGYTNGVELGDPLCVWTPGTTPSQTKGILHPGINDDNPQCVVPPWLWSVFFWWSVVFETPNSG